MTDTSRKTLVADGTRDSEPAVGLVRLSELRPSPENDRLYRPVDVKDPGIRALAQSIRRYGLREAIVVTLDGWIVSGHRRFSDRQIHYALLNDPPLKHASNPRSRYDNTARSYNNLTELLTRARINGIIPWQAIADETRPVSIWRTFETPQRFIGNKLAEFLKGYWRNLQQGQPNHIEIIGEKNTVSSILKPVAMKYCIPLTITRGFCSLPPRKAIADRFTRSGCEKLVLLIASDFDPLGEEIFQSFARSMRDDFGIKTVRPIKFALNAQQAKRFDLPPAIPVKTTSANFRKFVKKHGGFGWELEALAPEMLQELLEEAINSVIDMEALNSEVDAEREDAAFLQAVRSQVSDLLSSLRLDEEGEL